MAFGRPPESGPSITPVMMRLGKVSVTGAFVGGGCVL
jgi:hypothetical protein